MIPHGLSYRINDESFTTSCLSWTFHFPFFLNSKYCLCVIHFFVLYVCWKKTMMCCIAVLYFFVIFPCCIFLRVEFLFHSFVSCFFVWEIFMLYFRCCIFLRVGFSCYIFVLYFSACGIFVLYFYVVFFFL